MEFLPWHIWLIVSILCLLLEIFIPSFIIFNFGIGALFSTLFAALGASLEWQIISFSFFTMVSFFTVRPALVKWAYKRSHHSETNVSAMIGQTAKVTETINASKNCGRVKLYGDEWQAKSEDGQVIELDALVQIVKVESIIVTVKPL